MGKWGPWRTIEETLQIFLFQSKRIFDGGRTWLGKYVQNLLRHTKQVKFVSCVQKALQALKCFVYELRGLNYEIEKSNLKKRRKITLKNAVPQSSAIFSVAWRAQSWK